MPKGDPDNYPVDIRIVSPIPDLSITGCDEKVAARPEKCAGLNGEQPLQKLPDPATACGTF